ncbi:hypothetical protein PT115_09195, partial [Erysipelothrix rhusiopathiae]|nr:hypothetical protein [Erysipelothrix rhusiopathiae]
RDNNYQGKVRVTSEDGLNSKDYDVTYVVSDPVYDHTTLTLDRSERINDGTIAFENRWTNWVNNFGDKQEEWVMLEFEKIETI